MKKTTAFKAILPGHCVICWGRRICVGGSEVITGSCVSHTAQQLCSTVTRCRSGARPLQGC